MPLPTKTQTSLPVWIPLPTLTPNDAEKLVRDLLINNGGCRLPCWWGINPGETSWQEANQFLVTFATKIEQGTSGVIVENGTTYDVTDYSVIYDNNEIVVSVGLFIRDDIVNTIYAGSDITTSNYQVDQLLSEYGKPDKVLIKTYTNTPGLGLPFRLVLFYKDYKILAFYEFEAQIEGNYLRGCPQRTNPWLRLGQADKKWTDEAIDLAISGPDSPNPLRPLEEVTNMSIDDFYETFKNPESKSCIVTPMEYWP